MRSTRDFNRCRNRQGLDGAALARARRGFIRMFGNPCRTYGALADGSYTFQVQALGSAGVSGSAGPAASSTFLVDTTPPVISSLRFTLTGGDAGAPAPGPAPHPGPGPGLNPAPAPAPAGSAAVVLPSGAFTAAFDVTDGVLGSGVNGCAPCRISETPCVQFTMLYLDLTGNKCASLLI